MVADHLADIHLINMVAAKNRDIVGVGRFDKVQELIDRIGGAFEPLFAVAVGLRRNRVKELAMTDQPRPEFLDMLVQRIGAVLGQDVDLLDSGVEQIAQNEIDDFVFAAERDAGFGAIGRNLSQPFAFTAGQDHRNGVPGHVAQRKHLFLPLPLVAFSSRFLLVCI